MTTAYVAITVIAAAANAFSGIAALAPGCVPPDMNILAYYVPLIAWAPLLYAVTYQYHRRNRARRDAS